MSEAHNGLEQEVKKILLRIAKGSTIAEMLLQHRAFFIFFLMNIFNAAILQVNRKGKENLQWSGFQSVPYRSRPLHFLSLEGTTKETRISNNLPKI